MSSDGSRGIGFRVRLGLVTNDFPPRVGGIQTYIVSLLECLDPEEVVVVAPEVRGRKRFDEKCSVEVIRIDTPTGALIPTRRTARIAASLLGSRGVNLAGLTSMVPLAPLGVRTARHLGVPLVVWHHGAELSSLAQMPIGSAILRRYGASVGVHFVVSNWTGSIARSVFGEGADIRLMRFGVDTVRFRPPSFDEEKAKSRERAGITANDADPLLLSVGRLVKRKGNDVLLQALALMRSRYPSCALVIAGAGPDRNRLESLAGESGIADRVQFLGSVENEKLPELYRGADIFAAPIRSRFLGMEGEGLGITLVEAASSGLPVVAGRSGGTPEAVLDGVSGFVVDGRDPYEVASALSTLAADSALRRAMGAKGREYVSLEFSKARMVEVFRRAAGEILARTR